MAHTAYRRVYDVLNVFAASGFYPCADALIKNGTLGPQPPAVIVNPSLSLLLEVANRDRALLKIKNGESRLSYIKKDEYDAISALVQVRRGKGSSEKRDTKPKHKRIRTRAFIREAGDEELFEDTLSQSPLSLKRSKKRRDELAVSAAESAQKEAESGVPQEWISMGTSSSLSTDMLYGQGHCENDALMEVLYTSHSDHFEYLPLLDDDILFGGAGATMHMTAGGEF
jgi:hypothetical protein